MTNDGSYFCLNENWYPIRYKIQMCWNDIRYFVYLTLSSLPLHMKICWIFLSVNRWFRFFVAVLSSMGKVATNRLWQIIRCIRNAYEWTSERNLNSSWYGDGLWRYRCESTLAQPSQYPNQIWLVKGLCGSHMRANSQEVAFISVCGIRTHWKNTLFDRYNCAVASLIQLRSYTEGFIKIGVINVLCVLWRWIAMPW